MDHGYTNGDPILWLSKLKIYNQAGNVIAQGAGFSNPLADGGAGSTTWYDDFLQTTIAAAGTYYVEVGSWLLSTGLPVGVDYDLQVSVQQHPSPASSSPRRRCTRTASGNNTTPQNIDDASNWYTFFNSIIGDGTGGSISSGRRTRRSWAPATARSTSTRSRSRPRC